MKVAGGSGLIGSGLATDPLYLSDQSTTIPTASFLNDVVLKDGVWKFRTGDFGLDFDSEGYSPIPLRVNNDAWFQGFSGRGASPAVVKNAQDFWHQYGALIVHGIALPSTPFYLTIVDPTDQTVFEVVRAVSRAGRAQSGYKVERAQGNTRALHTIAKGWKVYLGKAFVPKKASQLLAPPAFDVGIAPDPDPGDNHFLDPMVYKKQNSNAEGVPDPLGGIVQGFFNGYDENNDIVYREVVLPSALWHAVMNIVAQPDGTQTNVVRAVAIPYVTFDGEDASESPIVWEDYGLTDAWVTDFNWLSDNGLTFTGVSFDIPYDTDLDPSLVEDWGIDTSKFGFLGTAIPGNNDPLLVFVSLPGLFLTDAIVQDVAAMPEVNDTGTWDFTTLTPPGPWSAFLHTEETGVNAPTPPAHGIFMFEENYTGHSETGAAWSSLAPPDTSLAILISRWDRHGNDGALFITGMADPRGLSNTVSGSDLDIIAHTHSMRVTDLANGSWIEGTIHTDFNGHLYMQALNDQSDEDVPPQDRPLIAVTLLMDITDADLTGGGLGGGQPTEGDHLKVTWRGFA